MATTALAQEKVWFNKPVYDKAACQHFEKLAKVMADKLKEEQQELKALAKNKKVSWQDVDPAVRSCNEQSPANPSKKSKDNNNKAAKKYRSMKKSKSNAVDTKEQVIQQENQEPICPIIPASGSLANEIAKARQHIKKSLQGINGAAACPGASLVPEVNLQDVITRFAALEKENRELRNSVEEVRNMLKELDMKVNAKSWPHLAICPTKPQSPPAPKKEQAADDDDDVDLFGSDSEGEDEEAAKIRQERLAAYNAKKSKKPVLIAKSNIILDVKPWDDETDMKALEAEVRKVECDGLLWGAAKLVPLAYGIHKLQISCVVEDEKVSVDWLTEKIQEVEDFVQSVDIAAFNKV